MERRQILQTSARLIGGLMLTPWLLRAAPARAENAEVDDQDRIMGEPDAPVTIIEYASLTCSHCRDFHTETLPEVKANWIEPGKARLVFRQFPLNGVDLRAGAVANCMEQDQRYFAFVDALYRNQDRWARSGDPIENLEGMAKLAGVDEETFKTCVENDAEMEKILARAREGAAAFDVKSTPTFVVNGKTVSGFLSFDEFEKVLNEASS